MASPLASPFNSEATYGVNLATPGALRMSFEHRPSGVEVTLDTSPAEATFPAAKLETLDI